MVWACLHAPDCSAPGIRGSEKRQRILMAARPGQPKPEQRDYNRKRRIIQGLLRPAGSSRIPQRRTITFLVFLTLIVTSLLIIDDGSKFTNFGSDTLSLKYHAMANWSEMPQRNRAGLASVTCRVPRFHPLDKGIWKYYRAPPSRIQCKEREINFASVHLDTEELELLPAASSSYCYLEDVLREGDDNVIFSNRRRLTVGRHRLAPKECVQAVRVSCFNIFGLTIYSHIFLVPPKVILKPAYTGKLDNVIGDRTQNKDKGRKNVFIFGVDSVSRLAAIRLLPLTYNYLVYNLSAVVMRLHHKVGDNTFPNLMTILSGDRQEPTINGTPSHNVDTWPLIWKRFSDEGYETFYGEDFPSYATFNYLRSGFRHPPTNHYMRPFWLAVENSMLMRSSSVLCYGTKPKYKLHLDYIKYFIQKARTSPYFAFSFLVEISHEYQEYVGAADQHFVEILSLLREQVLAGETLLVILSDHGHRFDSIRQSPQGHIEERLPFVSIVTADPRQQSILEYNSNMLTSHYDLYEVLRSLLPERSQPESTKYGINILQDKVPNNRTCAQAGIPEVFCTCENGPSRRSDDRDAAANSTAKRAVEFINKMIQDDVASRSRCKALSLAYVRSVFPVGQETVIGFETAPGEAFFELRLRNLSDPLSETMFSRINRYGTPCIKNDILRKYCYCGP